MDFKLGSNLLRSTSATASSTNAATLASETDNKLRLYGASLLNKDSSAAKLSLQESINGGMLNFSSSHSQMLSFSSHNASIAAFPFVRSSSGSCFTTRAVYHCGGERGSFTPSQWMELEHQALIYKYITANMPIPSYLLIPIRKALDSSGSFLTSTARDSSNSLNMVPSILGWGGFHLGFSKADPEPGRCRRTDGKKWRCSRDAVADQKYCERHMNRGRHRSRKPVEAQSGHSAAGVTTPSADVLPAKSLSLLHHNHHTPSKTRCVDGYTEFGSVCSDSLLNPLEERKSERALRQFIEVSASPTKRKLVSEGQSSWVPVSVGGPLGEALQRAGECKANRLASSPESSKTLDGASFCLVQGLMLPSLPAL